MLSLVTFANLGKKQNLKTSDIMPVLEIFSVRHELAQVICQINAGYEFQNTLSALPLPIRLALGALRRIRVPVSRQRIEKLFDFFAARKIQRTKVVLLHGGYFLTRTARAARKNGATVVDLSVSAHLSANAALERDELSYLGFPEYEGLYMKLEKNTTETAQFDYVIALSEFVKATYSAEGFPAERIVVASPDIDLVRFAPSAKKDTGVFTFLYMAHTQPLKGLHYLLDAWEQLSLRDAELIIVGGFTDMPDALITEYKKRMSQMETIRYVPGTNTPEQYYHEADVLVFPSLTEGFGRVTLEAMACALPVITTENARGIVEEGVSGFIVSIRDAGALASKIEFLYTNQDRAREMGRAGRIAAEHKKPFGEAVFALYEQVLEKHTQKNIV